MDTANPSVEEDIEARHLLGWWHWLRFLALPTGQGEFDFLHAVYMLEPIASTFPQVVPPKLVQYSSQDALVGLASQAIIFAHRYERTGDLTTLDRAITLFRRIATTTPESHPNTGRYLSNLGNSLQSRYDRTGDLAVLDEAIQSHRRAMAATRDDDPDRGIYLSGLSVNLGEPHVGKVGGVRSSGLGRDRGGR
jgi:hypothetical protein